MELQKECEVHMAALELLIQTSLNSIDTSSTNIQTPPSEFYERIISLKEEDERSLEGLKDKTKELQTTHDSVVQQIKLRKEEADNLKREKQNLQEQKLLKQKNLAKIKKEHDKYRRSVLEIKRHLSKDVESQNILNRNKNELLLYKQLSGISWDFAAAPDFVKGYVTNKETGYLKTFCFSKEMPSSLITEALWDLILSSSSECN